MLGFIIAVLVVSFGAATIGAVTSGLFWLTVIAMAALLLTGAVGLSLLPPVVEDDDALPVARKAEVLVIAAGRSHGRGRPSRYDGSVRRAA